MTFIISKIISFFVDPLIWIVLLLIIGRWIRNRTWKKRCYITALVCGIIFTNPYLLNRLWNSYQWQPVRMETLPQVKAGILLGGLSGYDEKLKMGFFGQTADRFIQTNRLYDAGKINHILVTGGNAIFIKDQSYSEAEFLIRNFEELKIPPQHLLTESRAKNTLQNAAYSKQILDSLHLEGPVILITSAIHMPRAVRVFRKAGLTVIPFPSNYQVTPANTEFNWRNFIPNAGTLSNWSTLLREWMGWIQLALVSQ